MLHVTHVLNTEIGTIGIDSKSVTSLLFYSKKLFLAMRENYILSYKLKASGDINYLLYSKRLIIKIDHYSPMELMSYIGVDTINNRVYYIINESMKLLIWLYCLFVYRFRHDEQINCLMLNQHNWKGHKKPTVAYIHLL